MLTVIMIIINQSIVASGKDNKIYLMFALQLMTSSIALLISISPEEYRILYDNGTIAQRTIPFNPNGIEVGYWVVLASLILLFITAFQMLYTTQRRQGSWDPTK